LQKKLFEKETMSEEEIYEKLQENVDNIEKHAEIMEQRCDDIISLKKELKERGVKTPRWVKEIKLPSVKGKSGFTVDESFLPEYYLVVEHSKRRNEQGELQIVKTKVYPEECKRIETILKKIDDSVYKNKKIPGYVLIEQICRDAKLHRFFDEDGVLHKDTFYGDRPTYFKYFYYPLKVLSHYKKLIHTLCGNIKKTEESQHDIEKRD
jgi:hypothetical protein